MERFFILLIIAASFTALILIPQPDNIVKAETALPQENQVIEIPQPLHTQSRFEEKITSTTTILPQKTVYKDDPETEAGTDTVVTEGSDGKKVITTKTSYYEGEEYSKEIVSTETTPAVNKVISRGTKIVWKTLPTPDGEIRYWKKLTVYATHYDSRCPGCNETTAIGMKAGKGVIAVDPSVIKLRSKVYIPGYGQAIAGDTGGAIKGNIMELGFDDARTAGWSARTIDIYLQ
jgi:3D (Asp-Asp-Asp) domain-containing protein